MTVRLRIVHTADLRPAELQAVRALLDAAFEGDYDDGDWEHTLGGLHILVSDERGLAAHGAVIQRRARYRKRWLRVGYVEGVGVRADARRQGLGGRVMGEVERIIDGAYDLGALSASDEGAPLYEARGWRLWRGRLCGLGPRRVVRLRDDEDCTYVRPGAGGSLDVTRKLVFDWRDGDVL